MSNHCPATCHSYTLEPEAGFSLINLRAGEKMVVERGDFNSTIPFAKDTLYFASAPTTTN